MPDTLREIQKPGLPHCSRRFVFYTTRRGRVQGDVYEVEAALWNPAPSTTHDSSLRCESCSGLTVFIHCADVRIFDGCHKDSHGLPGPEQCVSACSAQIRVPTKRRARGPAPHKLPHRSYKVAADSAMGRCCRIGPSHCHAAEQTDPARRSRGVSPPSRAAIDRPVGPVQRLHCESRIIGSSHCIAAVDEIHQIDKLLALRSGTC